MLLWFSFNDSPDIGSTPQINSFMPAEDRSNPAEPKPKLERAVSLIVLSNLKAARDKLNADGPIFPALALLRKALRELDRGLNPKPGFPKDPQPVPPEGQKRERMFQAFILCQRAVTALGSPFNIQEVTQILDEAIQACGGDSCAPRQITLAPPQITRRKQRLRVRSMARVVKGKESISGWLYDILAALERGDHETGESQLLELMGDVRYLVKPLPFYPGSPLGRECDFPGGQFGFDHAELKHLEIGISSAQSFVRARDLKSAAHALREAFKEWTK